MYMRVLTVNKYNILQEKRFNTVCKMYDFSFYPSEYKPKIEDYIASYKGKPLKYGYVAMSGNLHICRKTKRNAVAVLKKYIKERKAWHSFYKIEL